LENVRFSVVVPCFNEEQALPIVLEQLVPALQRATEGAWEIILVDDGSSDKTQQIIRSSSRREPRIKGLVLSRNFGHQPAVTTGLTYACGEYVGVMDADLQDPVDILIQCFSKASEHVLDVVYAVRQHREGNLLLRALYKVFYYLIDTIAEYPWPLDAGDFSVISRRAANILRQFPENVRIFRGLRSWIGLKQSAVFYDRPARVHGKSKYNLFKLLALAGNAIVSFSTVPLRFVSLFGLLMSVTALFVGLFMLINRLFPQFTLFGYKVGANPGTTTLVILFSTFSSLIFLCLATIGEYLALIVKEIKSRPVTIVADQIGSFKSWTGRTAIILEELNDGRSS
jgi:polyisoprenyl-phosphate glycosyltransferase